MSSAQIRLSEYLQSELHHTLGAYGVAEQRFAELVDVLSGVAPTQRAMTGGELRDLPWLSRVARDYNGALNRFRDDSRLELRHPVPDDLPLSLAARFAFEPEDPDQVATLRTTPWVRPVAWGWVSEFYKAATTALGPQAAVSTDGDARKAQRLSVLADNLLLRRDGSPSAAHDDAGQSDVERRRRHDRFAERHHLAEAYLSGNGSVPSTGPSDYLERIATDNLSTARDGTGSLPLFVVNALVEAHLAMHAVEAWQHVSLGKAAEFAADVVSHEQWLHAELDRCIALNTFVYCVSRCAPWLFAEDEAESRKVFGDFATSWANVVPTRCMWIGSQLSLLALFRRAYARALRGDTTNAYNDYHKLQRQLRDTERRVQAAPIHVVGALEFLAALDAQAHHHIGELYRSAHAQRPALKHFRSASHRLKPIRDRPTIRDVLTDSRWNIQLEISHGKAHYEMGRHKESLCCYLRGWRAFLLLLAADTRTEASTEDLDAAIDWLSKVRYEPEVRKPDLVRYVGPVVAQLDQITIASRLGGLAAEILLRLGHLLFVLNIGRLNQNVVSWQQPTDGEAKALNRRRITETLAFDCLRKAAECDPHSTLTGADLLKARLRFAARYGREFEEEYADLLKAPSLEPVTSQRPRGSNDYERLARVAEYLLLRALHANERNGNSSGEAAADAAIARDLMLNFFMSTDSINVRKSQVHRFLMRERVKGPRIDGPEGRAIEFVCMRRYSSAFPLLPRPSAFRALGGGYFVRLLHEGDGDGRQRPFGVVIDPGADFVENLYRTGFSLTDIDMIVVTHDHVDHLGSLDPLLSLMHEHSQIRDKESRHSTAANKLTLVVNQSVMDRYRNVVQVRGVFDEKTRTWEHGRNVFHLLESFANGASAEEIDNWPSGFEIVSMSSAAIAGDGHVDLSGNPSYGLCIRVAGGGPSIAFTSDTPAPDKSADDNGRADDAPDWTRTWRAALEADVLVVHLSTVPLTELRQLAQLTPPPETVHERDIAPIRKRVQRLRKQATTLLDDRQLARLRDVVAATELSLRRLEEQTVVTLINGDRSAPSHAALQQEADTLRGLGSRIARSRRSKVHSGLEQLQREAHALAHAVESLPTERGALDRMRNQLEGPSDHLKGQIEFSLWLRSHKGPTADLVGQVPDAWQTPENHAFLQGVLAWARRYHAFRDRLSGDPNDGLLVIGELSEELGTVRGKIAGRLNTQLFGAEAAPGDRPRIHAITSDIGLTVRIASGTPSSSQVQCTTCSLDTDRVATERFHPPHAVREICVKGENEGIFHNCVAHDPMSQREPVFLEQLERFDVFGR